MADLKMRRKDDVLGLLSGVQLYVNGCRERKGYVTPEDQSEFDDMAKCILRLQKFVDAQRG